MSAASGRERIPPEVNRVLSPSLLAVTVGLITLLIVGFPSQNVSDADGTADLQGLAIGAIALTVVALGGFGVIVAAVVWIRDAIRRPPPSGGPPEDRA
jgi:hypothetical protein